MPRGKNGAANGNARRQTSNSNHANLGFEAQLFLAADKLRKNLEPSDYKHVCLGLIFLKHISNAFEVKRAALLAEDAAARRGPGRVPCRERVLGTEGCPLVSSSSQREVTKAERMNDFQKAVAAEMDWSGCDELTAMRTVRRFRP
jgi:hypothetical protein